MDITTTYLRDGSRLILADGPRDLEGRVVFTWEVRAADMRIIAQGADLRTGVNGPADHFAMAETFASFVGAWVESFGYAGSENADLFPQSMREWAERNADELWTLTYRDSDEF